MARLATSIMPTVRASAAVNVTAKAFEKNGSGVSHALKYTTTDRHTLVRNTGELNSSLAASRIPGPM
jgi:hypothetical protein